MAKLNRKSATRSTGKRRGKAKTLPTRFQPQFWEDLDQRLNLTRAIKEHYETLLDETGADTLAKRMLAQRAIFMALRIETMETEAASTGEFNQNAYTTMVNALSGLLTKLGLENSSRTVINLQDYVSSKNGTSV